MKEVKVKMVVDSTEAKEGVDNLSGSVDKMSGGVASAFKSFTAGLSSVAAGFRTVGGAIALSGLGLLVITIAAVSAAFKGSEEGQNKFAKIMTVIGAITGNFVDLLADLGDLLINAFENPQASLKAFGKLLKDNIVNRFEGLMELLPALGKAIGLLFEGEFSEAGKVATNAVGKVALGIEDVTGKINDATDAVGGFIEQNKKEAKLAAEVADKRAKADLIERNLLADKAKAEREIATLRLKAKDLNNVSAEEREKALLKVLDIQDDLITRETEVLELRRDAQLTENEFARSTKENLDEAARLTAAVIDKEAERTNQKRTIQRELTQAENEINRKAKEQQKIKDEEQKVIDAEEKARIKSIFDFKNSLVKQNEDLEAETAEQKLELQRERATAELEALVGTETEKRESLLALNKLYDQKESDLAKKKSDEEIAQAKKTNDAKITLADAEKDAKLDTLSAISGGLTALAQLDKENAALSKATGVASAIIDTFVGANKAFAQGGVAGFVTGGAIIASGLANVATILSTPLPDEGASAAPQTSAPPSFNLVEGTEGNQIQNSIQNTNETPVRAFVVAQDVTSQQSLDRQIEANSGI